MTGLMFKQPEDHVDFLIGCLNSLKAQGNKPQAVKWNTFIQANNAPAQLPPVRPGSNHISNEARLMSARVLDKSVTNIAASNGSSKTDIKNKYTQPLPSITKRTVKFPVVFFVGHPGSPRIQIGNQLCSKHLGLVQIDVGNLLREHICKADRDLVDQGEMVPNEIVIQILLNEINKLEKAEISKVLLINGYPRSVSQAKDWEKYVGNVNHVIYLYNNDNEMQTKLQENHKGITEDAIKSRIEFFKTNRMQLQQLYENDGKISIIKTDRSVDDLVYNFSNFVVKVFPELRPKKPVVPPKNENVETITKVDARHIGKGLRNPDSDPEKHKIERKQIDTTPLKGKKSNLRCRWSRLRQRHPM